MRLGTWLLAVGMGACVSFSEGDASVPTFDGGIDGADASTTSDAASDVVSDAPEAGAACDASRICIDFETPSQRTSPFGFETVTVDVDGGMAITDAGFGSGNALTLKAVDNFYSRGQINLPDVPKELRVRMKVRADSRDAAATSDHFLMLTCGNGDGNMSAKLSLDGRLAVQIGGDGQDIGAFTDGTWLPIDAVATFTTGSRKISVVRLDTNTSKTMTTTTACTPPLSIRVQSSLTGSNEVGHFTLSVDDIAIDWN